MDSQQVGLSAQSPAIRLLQNKPAPFFIVLTAFNRHDPLGCFEGWDVNPDEYATETTEVMLLLSEISLISDVPLSEAIVTEAVRRSFGIEDIANQLVSMDAIEEIAREITPHFITRTH